MVDPIQQDDGTFKNEAGAVTNDVGHLIDDDGALINEDGFLVNDSGLLLNEAGETVDKEGNLVDAEGKLIDDADDTANLMIPKHRYDSASQRAKAAEDALAKATDELSRVNANTDTAGGDPTTTADFEAKIDELDAQIEAARKDGDVDTVVRLGKEQRTYERTMFNNIATQAAEGAGTKAQQAVAFDALVVDLEARYSVFDQDSKEFDQELVNEVLDMHEAFVMKGDTPAAAMAKAVGYVMPEQKSAQERNTDTAKNLKAAKDTAPAMGGTGAGSDAGGDTGDAGDVGNMTDAEFDALPASTKKRMRGDSYAG